MMEKKKKRRRRKKSKPWRKFLKIKHNHRFFYTSNYIRKHGSYQKQATFLFSWPPELYTRRGSS